MRDPLETYKRSGRKIVDKFLRREITVLDCVSALADALVTARGNIAPDQMLRLADAALTHNAQVMGEIERRVKKRNTEAKSRAKAIKKLVSMKPL